MDSTNNNVNELYFHMHIKTLYSQRGHGYIMKKRGAVGNVSILNDDEREGSNALPHSLYNLQ